MAGLIFLQQGPLAVAATARRPVEKPGTASRKGVADTAGATLDHSSSHPPPPQQLPRRNSQQHEGLAPDVSSATLLEASLIAAALPPSQAAIPAPLPGRPDPWQPPASTLSLRDRSV